MLVILVEMSSDTEVRGRCRGEALDGLRGIAALGVVLSHTILFFGLLGVAPHGGVGVVVFFTLSGYLISTLCWRRPPSITAYRAFVRRRVVRLGPVLLAMLAVTGPLFVVAGIPARDVLRSAGIALVQGTGVAIAAGVEVVLPIHPTWSLGVEWVFYLAFPAALAILRTLGAPPPRVVFGLVGSAAALFSAGLWLSPTAFYYLPVANVGVLLLGAALATWHHHRPTATGPDPAWSMAGLVVILGLLVLPNAGVDAVWELGMLPALTAASLLVIQGCRTTTLTSRILAGGPLPAVGRRAYSLYLWHLPVMWLVSSAASGWAGPARAGLALAVVAIVVAVSYHVIERPVLTGHGVRTAPVRGPHDPGSRLAAAHRDTQPEGVV